MAEKSKFWKDGCAPESASDEETTNNSSHQKGKINMDDAIKPEMPQHNSFISRNQMRANITKPNWLIKGILKRGTSNLLFGESGAGKSLYALDWAFCIANGINWHEHKVKEKGVVLVIAGEGYFGFAMRDQALCQKYKIENPSNDIHYSIHSFNLLDESIIDVIIEEMQQKGIKPDLIIVDTLNRNMDGDENRADDVAKYAKGIEKLARDFDACILTVHHSGLADKNRARGSTALNGAMESTWAVLKVNDFETTLTCTKMKEGAKPMPLSFGIYRVELDGVEFYDEDDDKQIEGVYLEYNGLAKAKAKEGLKGNQKAVFDAMNQIIDDGNGVRNGDSDQEKLCLTANYDQFMITNEKLTEYLKAKMKPEIIKQAIYDNKKSLKTKGLIYYDGVYSWLV